MKLKFVRRANPFSQRQAENLHRFIEIGLGLARAPRTGHDRVHGSIGKEIEPLPVGAPGGAEAVESITRQGCRRSTRQFVKVKLAKRVKGVLAKGHEAAVGRPFDLLNSLAVSRDFLALAVGDVGHPQVVVLVSEREVLAVGVLVTAVKLVWNALT